MSMKGTLDEPLFSVELLKESAALRDVIDKHIHDQTLVSMKFRILLCFIYCAFSIHPKVYVVFALGAEECFFCC